MKPGRERAKAWIHSVINPLLDGLRIEASFLAKRNWTFRQHSRDLEFVRPARAFLDYQSRPNWEDFTASNPKIQERLLHRDERREELRKPCSAAFDELIGVKEFQQEVLHCLTVFQQAEGGNLGQVPQNVVAELIVNNVAELPDHYSYHRFWSRFGAELLRRFRIGEGFDHADQAGLELKKSNDDLSAELMKVRSDLAEEYDIPWAPYYDESLALPSR